MENMKKRTTINPLGHKGLIVVHGRHLVDAILTFFKTVANSPQGYDAVAVWGDGMTDLLDMGI